MSNAHHAAGVSLRTVLADDLVARPHDVRVTSCAGDARQVRPGDAFIALPSAHGDGHDDAALAIRRGAAAVVCERLLPVFKIPQFVVRDTRAAYGRLCQALVGNPSQQVKVIGVTGTSGKTTVVRLLDAILHEAGARAGTIDSLACCAGSDFQPMAGIELSPPLVARWLARMAADGVSHAVLEVSSRGLCQSLLAGVELDAVCLTHVGRAHLDWHGSVVNYRQAKRQILDHLRAEGVAIFNADCQSSMRFLAEHDGPALTFGRMNPAEISAEIIEQHVNEQIFVLTAGNDSAAVRTAIVGDHHVDNCLAAAATALAYGIDLAAIARGLEALDELPGRMQRLACGQGFAVFVDAADSPDALRACLRAARTVTAGRVICVVGADHLTNRDERATLGRVAGALADCAVITTNTLRHCGLDDFSCDVVYGFADPRKAHVILDRTEAIRFALDEAREGDTVVLAGTGEREFPGADAGSVPCDDAGLVRLWLTGSNQFAAGFRVAA